MPFLGNVNSIKKSLIIATALACTLFSGSVVARETQVVALKIDGLLQKDGQGLYDQVFAAVNQISGNDLTMRVVAPAATNTAMVVPALFVRVSAPYLDGPPTLRAYENRQVGAVVLVRLLMPARQALCNKTAIF